jgi:hypothetical protein
MRFAGSGNWKRLQRSQIPFLRANYRAVISGRLASIAGAHTTVAGGPSETPPKRALFACPRHSPDEDRQPVTKSREQTQADNKIHFIFND